MDDMMKEMMMKGGPAGPTDMDPAMMAVMISLPLPSLFLSSHLYPFPLVWRPLPALGSSLDLSWVGCSTTATSLVTF